MTSHRNPAPAHSPVLLETDDNAKITKELQIPWDHLKNNPEKIRKLVDFSLSLLGRNKVALLAANKITFLYNALYAMLHVLFMPRDLLPEGTEIILDRIMKHRITKSKQWMVFDEREVRQLSLLLRCGRWTYLRLIAVRTLFLMH